MRHDEVRNQLCKMTAEIGRRLGFDDDQLHCLCEAAEHEDKYTGEIPDAIIEEMWRRLTHGCWKATSAQPPLAQECFDQSVQQRVVPNEER